MGTTQECYMPFWTNIGSNTSQNSNCTATYLPSHKPSKKDEQGISNVLWTLTHGHASVGWLARTYLYQLCVNTRCSLEDLPQVTVNRDEQQEKVRENCDVSVIWWWDPENFCHTKIMSFPVIYIPMMKIRAKVEIYIYIYIYTHIYTYVSTSKR